MTVISSPNREVTITKILARVLALTFFASASYANGALARNPKNNKGVVVVNKNLANAAAHDAALACGPDCQIVITFQNACVSYAADKANSKIWGYGRSDDTHTADEKALDRCAESGGDCAIESSGCDAQ